MKGKIISGCVKVFTIALLLLASTLVLTLSTKASPGELIADNPSITVGGTGDDFNWAAWHGWWVRYGSTDITFTFTGINTAAIPTSHVLVNFNLGVTNHADGEGGLDGLVDITINPGGPSTYTLADVLFDNMDYTNQAFIMGTGGTYMTMASILVNKEYIQGGNLVIKVHRHTDADGAPTASGLVPIDMSTSTPTIPPNVYEANDARRVHIYVSTTDSSGTVAEDGVVTIYSKQIVTGVGGFDISVDKLGLLVPYIGLASTIIVAAVATTIYVKRRKKKQ